MNNWYHKIAMTLPDFKNLPEEEFYPTGLESIDERMIEQKAKEESEKHPGWEYIDSGSYGAAFVNPDNPSELVKYTTHEEEYIAINQVLNLQKEKGVNSLPGLIPIKNIEIISSGLYKINTEKMEQLNETEIKLILNLSSFNEFWALQQDVRSSTQNIEEVPLKLKEILEQYKKRDIKFIEFTRVIEDYAKHYKQDIYEILAKFFSLYINLNNLGFKHWDLTIYNIGKDKNGNYVVFDLGGLELL